MAEVLESLSESFDIALSKEWRDFEENSLHKFLAVLHKEETAAYDLLGMPCTRIVTTGSQLRIQPRHKPSLQVAEYPEIGDDINTEYIALSRETPPGSTVKQQPTKWRVRSWWEWTSRSFSRQRWPPSRPKAGKCSTVQAFPLTSDGFIGASSTCRRGW
ncbi:hypothetical protein TgHK011_003820 [Trichoderma gracile]|nr:hypothetical protein TgHK011_003820 [Trichoderma gracile]